MLSLGKTPEQAAKTLGIAQHEFDELLDFIKRPHSHLREPLTRIELTLQLWLSFKDHGRKVEVSSNYDGFVEIFVSKLATNGYPFRDEDNGDVIISEELKTSDSGFPDNRLLSPEPVDELVDLDKLAELDELRRILARVLSTMIAQERKVIKLRFGLVDGESHTFEEIGDFLGLLENVSDRF